MKIFFGKAFFSFGILLFIISIAVLVFGSTWSNLQLVFSAQSAHAAGYASGRAMASLIIPFTVFFFGFVAVTFGRYLIGRKRPKNA